MSLRLEKRYCKECNKLFQPKHKSQRFHSVKCANKVRTRNRKGKSLEEFFGNKRGKDIRRKHEATYKKRKRSGWVSYRKGKTYREIYGVKRAKSERKKRDMHTRKGKTREEIFGKRIANKMKRALAKSHKGLPGWGKGLTKETSSIIKQRGIDISLWNKKYPKERIERTKKFMKASGIRPTKPEKKVISFIKQNRLPYKYVGDGDFWLTLGGIDINPDFINFKHKKEFIEVLGCYWHRCLKCRIANAYISAKVEKNVQRDRLKTKLLKKYGYKVIRIWEHEIKDGSFIKKIVGGSYGKNVTHRKRM